MMIANSNLFFLLENRLDQASIIGILKFLTVNEINNLASLMYRSDSVEIEMGMYHESYLELKFGNCLMIYCWRDELWKDYITGKIVRINNLLRDSIIPIEIVEIVDDCNKYGNVRLKFIKYLWKRIGSENWNLIKKKRHDRKLYISSLSDKFSEIAQYKNKFKNPKCERLIRKRIEQACFIEESSLLQYLTEPIYFDVFSINSSIEFEKWFSLGMSVGKTSLLMIVSGEEFPFAYIPRVFDAYNASVNVWCINKQVEKRKKVGVQCGFWDTGKLLYERIDNNSYSVGTEEYIKLRALGYPDTTIFTLNYAINDWSSLTQLAENLMWEATLSQPNATFVVVSTKNDLKEECYWNSLLEPSSIEEPISPEDGIMFTKAIGAISLIETSAKIQKGTYHLLMKLVFLRLIHLQHLKAIERSKLEHVASGKTEMNFSKKCSVQ